MLGIAILLIVGAFVVRSVLDISYAVGPDEYVYRADTSDGHVGRMVLLFVVGLALLFFL